MIRILRTAATAAALSLSTLAAAQAAAPAAKDFARDAAIEDVTISPDGKHIMALTSPDGENRLISIWKTDAPGEAPVVILPLERMRYLGARFIKNDRIGVTAIQTFTYGADKGHLTKFFITDLEGKNWSEPLNRRDVHEGEVSEFLRRVTEPTVLSTVPKDPDIIIVEDVNFDGQGDIYKVNVHNGRAERIDRASSKYGSVQVDLNGEIRAKQLLDFDQGDIYIAQLIKNPDTGAFEEHFRWYAKNRESIEVIAFAPDPNLAYVLTNRDQDKSAIYLYDIRQRKMVEPEFQHKLFDALAVTQSRSASDYGAVLGFWYDAERAKRYWADPQFAALDSGLDQALGVKTNPVQWTDPASGETTTIHVIDGAGAQIIGWSDDRGYFVVEKSGPSQPPEYYLMHDGKLALLGKSRPWMDTAALGETSLVQIKARDGLMTPAIVTKPPKSLGAGPFPAIILPHGGPWARDEMDWDISGWTQYFAARGYVVLQPQYRGSEGWGQKLWRAGDAEWGQKMQDDKDDAAKWLIDQKLADPNRIAMFGYSYGGYAALAASIRPNGLYQCAISGAGAGDLSKLDRLTSDNRFQREFQNPTIKGLDPLDHAKEAKIPLFIYHGDRDQIVDVKQSRDFVSALKSAHLPYRYLEIKDMGHQYITMTPAMLETQLVEIEKYLKNECGPGGL